MVALTGAVDCLLTCTLPSRQLSGLSLGDHWLCLLAWGALQAGPRLSTDLDVKVLTTGFWPTYKSADLELPAEMIACVTAFQKFYDATTKHRNLTWIHNLVCAPLARV